MDVEGTSLFNTVNPETPVSTKRMMSTGPDFKSILKANASNVSTASSKTGTLDTALPIPQGPAAPYSHAAPVRKALAAYTKQDNHIREAGHLSDLQKYKDDQLLSNPGGDHYYLDENRVEPNPKGQDPFWERVGKDISDGFSNIKNFFKDLLFGSNIRYRGEQNEIREAQQKGLVGSAIDFFKDLGSALSFGAWRPDGEKEPEGFFQRAGFFFSKLKEAFFGDLVQGVCGSVIHMGEDILFAGWNLVETIPDATIGNFQAGQKLTTEFFDNGQVVLGYLTDILPGGDAWSRVHAVDLTNLNPPILQNINMPERNNSDDRWRFVRNTPFRKVIESVGSLVMDIITLDILGRIEVFSEDRNGKN